MVFIFEKNSLHVLGVMRTIFFPPNRINADLLRRELCVFGLVVKE